jgi:polysaccharide pyruvyl transferase WcaK-like protein
MKTRKVVGLVGYFGWGNYGDELFLEVYRQWLGDTVELRVLHDVLQKPYFSRSLDTVLDGVDAIVIGGGDLVIPWTVSELYWREEYLRLPVFVVGVGVPTWRGADPNVVARMAAFFQHPNVRAINTRDQESRAWIERHLRPSAPVTHSADLVFSLDLPRVSPCPQPILGIVTRDRKGEPDDLTQVRRLCEKARDAGYALRHIVLGTGVVGARDKARAADLQVDGKETVASEEISDLTRAIAECSVLASMKFHGTVVAAAYGIPSLVLTASNKSRNFLRMIERPELVTSLTDETLADRFSPYMASIPIHTRHFLRRRATGTMAALKARLEEL